MKTNSPDSQLARYFSAWLGLWVRKHRYTQLQAAIRLGVTPGFLNMVLNNKRAASAWQMEKTAEAVKVDVLEILRQGKEAIEGKGSATALAMSANDSLTAGLNKEQINSMQAYHKLLLTGGEGVDVITESIHFLAKKKIPAKP